MTGLAKPRRSPAVKAATQSTTPTQKTAAARRSAAPRRAPAERATTAAPRASSPAARRTASPTATPVAGTGASPSAEPRPAATTSLELYLLRHADAGDPASWTGDDAERPLSKKGRRQAKRLGSLLDALGFQPDAVITSPRLRAADTAKLVAKPIGADVLVDNRLGAGFGVRQLAAILGDLGGAVERVVLVGHDPDFSDLASSLVGAQIGLEKGALAWISLPDRGVAPGGGLLRWLLPPGAVPH